MKTLFAQIPDKPDKTLTNLLAAIKAGKARNKRHSAKLAPEQPQDGSIHILVTRAKTLGVEGARARPEVTTLVCLGDYPEAQMRIVLSNSQTACSLRNLEGNTVEAHLRRGGLKPHYMTRTLNDLMAAAIRLAYPESLPAPK